MPCRKHECADRAQLGSTALQGCIVEPDCEGCLILTMGYFLTSHQCTYLLHIAYQLSSVGAITGSTDLQKVRAGAL